jgi:DUF1009 family protein
MGTPMSDRASKPAGRIGILAGGGRLPSLIADSVIARGGSVHIVGVKGEADDSITAYPHTWVNWGQVGRMLHTLRTEGGGQMVIAGGVTRPILSQLRPDLGFFRVLPQVLRMLVGGDDSVLTRVVRVFELNGVTVRGAHEVAPDLLVPDGALGRIAISEEGLADAALARAVRDALAPLDAGQAVVVCGGRVLALEGAEGTDAMLQRVAQQRTAAGGPPRGILSKGPKPGQELRVDMPVIGARTIDGLQAAGLAGAVMETGRVLLLERAEAIAKADAAGIFVGAVRPEALPPWQHAAPPPIPRAAVPVGRRTPNARDLLDIERGLMAVMRLAPLGTGKGAVVSRAYVLGLEAEEGLRAMLARIGALRQWGLGKRRRVGVLVRRLDASDVAPDAETVLREAAAQGLAGVAITGDAGAVAGYEHAGALADDLGIFLTVCAASQAGAGR